MISVKDVVKRMPKGRMRSRAWHVLYDNFGAIFMDQPVDEMDIEKFSCEFLKQRHVGRKTLDAWLGSAKRLGVKIRIKPRKKPPLRDYVEHRIQGLKNWFTNRLKEERGDRDDIDRQMSALNERVRSLAMAQARHFQETQRLISEFLDSPAEVLAEARRSASPDALRGPP